MSVMKIYQRAQGRVTQTVRVSGYKTFPYQIAAIVDPIAGIGILAGVDDIDCRAQILAFEIIFEHGLAITGGKHELCEALVNKAFYQLRNDR